MAKEEKREGGKRNSDEAEDRKLIRKMVKPGDLKGAAKSKERKK